MCLQELRQEWLKWGGKDPWPESDLVAGAWAAHGAVSLCPCTAVLYLLPKILLACHNAFRHHQLLLKAAAAEEHDHSTPLFHITARDPPLLPLACIPHSDSQWHLSLLLIHYPNILASSGLLVALVTWHRHWNLMVNPETLYGGVISWFWFPLHFCSTVAKNTSKKWVWQWAPTPNSLHSN